MTPQYFYDGRDLAASLERGLDGWHVKDAKGVDLGTFPTREFAVAFINARIKSPPAAPLAREREADLAHLRDSKTSTASTSVPHQEERHEIKPCPPRLQGTNPGCETSTPGGQHGQGNAVNTLTRAAHRERSHVERW